MTREETVCRFEKKIFGHLCSSKHIQSNPFSLWSKLHHNLMILLILKDVWDTWFLPAITCLADFLQVYAHTLSSHRGLYFIFSVSKVLVLFFQRSLSWLRVFNATACSSASLLVLPIPFAYSLFSFSQNYCTFQNPISSNYLL